METSAITSGLFAKSDLFHDPAIFFYHVDVWWHSGNIPKYPNTLGRMVSLPLPYPPLQGAGVPPQHVHLIQFCLSISILICFWREKDGVFKMRRVTCYVTRYVVAINVILYRRLVKLGPHLCHQTSRICIVYGKVWCRKFRNRETEIQG